jgi:hypothetical protein
MQTAFAGNSLILKALASNGHVCPPLAMQSVKTEKIGVFNR